MFEAFHWQTVRSEVAINAIVGGAGQPVPLLHGHPQNLSMWARVAPLLACEYTVSARICGYRATQKPAQDEDLANDSFRRRSDPGDPGLGSSPEADASSEVRRVSARASAQQRKRVAYAGFQNFGRELRVGDCT